MLDIQYVEYVWIYYKKKPVSVYTLSDKTHLCIHHVEDYSTTSEGPNKATEQEIRNKRYTLNQN